MGGNEPILNFIAASSVSLSSFWSQSYHEGKVRVRNSRVKIKEVRRYSPYSLTLTHSLALFSIDDIL